MPLSISILIFYYRHFGHSQLCAAVGVKLNPLFFGKRLCGFGSFRTDCFKHKSVSPVDFLHICADGYGRAAFRKREVPNAVIIYGKTVTAKRIVPVALRYKLPVAVREFSFNAVPYIFALSLFIFYGKREKKRALFKNEKFFGPFL